MKAKDVCRNVDQRVQPQVQELVNQLQFMATKLKETKKTIKDEPLVIDYDNGGGQSGIRENPHYVAYEKLMATFNKTLTTLIDIIGEEKTSNEVMPLLALREKFKVAK